MQTTNQKDHLKALNDQLQAAIATHNEEAKAHITAALSHAQAAKTELQAKLRADHATNAASLQKTLDKLNEATAAAKSALSAKGTGVEEHLKASIAAAQAALAK